MVKLNISSNHLTIVSHQDFLVFSYDPNKLSWNFKQIVKCAENFPKTDGSIECCGFSPCENYFGICFDKNVVIYSTADWSTLYVSPGERKASSIQFFPNTKTVLIADKSGCATFYSFKNDKLQKTELALGHNSMLTTALITKDEKFVVTSDRDEKIRVTNYPNVYNIERYCLGHDMFVTCIGFLPSDERILVSSSGDGTIRFWDFIQGQELAVYDCNDSNLNCDVNENCRATLIKFVSCKVEQSSILAIQQYKSKQIKIIHVKGKLNISLKLELVKILTLNLIPWDIEFHNNTLVCLVPDKQNPVTVWSYDSEPKINFSDISVNLNANWESFISSANKILDEVPVLFKREVDNLQEYEQRKRARLLKTGKTS